MRKKVNEYLDIKTVLYKSQNVLLLRTSSIEQESKTAFIICEGSSLSIDELNIPYKWDPYLKFPNKREYKGTLKGDIIMMYFPFECKGLEEAGRDLAYYINENMYSYDNLMIIGHSKAGVCIANMAKMITRKAIFVFVSAPFEGTIINDTEKVKSMLSNKEYQIFRKYYTQHAVDIDVQKNSDFLRKVADFSGVKKHHSINVISECKDIYTCKDIVFKYFAARMGYKHSDGLVLVSSQESLTQTYPLMKTIYIDSSHAESLERLLSANRDDYIID